jgi:dolichyl-diphosphooligosaccharide--protein glycosyltransferase
MAKKEIKEIKQGFMKLVKNQKFQLGLTILVFLIILISSTSMRLSNLPVLKDETTGKYLSNDLDSFYFYRVAETQLKLGYLPEVDEMRAPGYDTPWVPELIDNFLIWNYKILHFFNSGIDFNYAATISAPIFFAIGLVLFFILSLLLTKSKLASLIATAFLAYIPGFLFRSAAGFYDHDHIGVFALFAFAIGAYFSIKLLEKSYKHGALFGILTGFLTALVFATWRGAITFVLVFFPVVLILHYFFNTEDKKRFILFYFVWFISSVIMAGFIGASSGELFSRFVNSQGILVLFVFGFIIFDYVVELVQNKRLFFNRKYNRLVSLAITFTLGTIGLLIIGKNPLTLAQQAWSTLIYPFFGDFGGRLAATVAENAQPYLVDLIGQTGKIMFGLFLLGLFLIAIRFSKNSTNLKNKMIISGSIIFLFFAILFSRISGSSNLNGENIISQMLYLAGVMVFLIGLAYVYSKEKFKIDVTALILFGFAITVIMNARAAIRSFFLITPFIALICGYGIIELWRAYKTSKDETLRIVVILGFIVSLLLVGIAIFGNPINKTPGQYQIISGQAQYVGSSANSQWQKAMAWARENTSQDSIFVHWWDYGYFVQTLGERASVTDGGHAAQYGGNINIGRYILTTPKPETAYSFMKTWNVSYLLIDPTEMGKYGAFSKIGSNDSWDRVSTGIFAGVSDDKQMQETSKGLTKVYQIGNCVDQDISYKSNGSNIYLPGISITKTQQIMCNSYVGGVIVEFQNVGNEMRVMQPMGIFVDNNGRQYQIPIKNIYLNGEMRSFETGIDSVVYLIPRVDDNNIDPTGALIYLSPRTFNSLVGKLYILNDYNNEYPGLTIANQQDDPVVEYFKQFTDGELNEFVYYKGLRAPLKIWEIKYPENTPVHEEFLNKSLASQGDLDYLFE